MEKKNELLDFGGFIKMLEIDSSIFTDINENNQEEQR
jgi:hypothetical protein